MNRIYALIFALLVSTPVLAQRDAERKQGRNAFTVGFMMGPVGVYSDIGPSYYYNGPGPFMEDGPSFSFTFAAEEYFNRSHPKVYFSLGGRLSTTYFQTPYRLYSSYYPYSYTTDDMLVGSLGVSTAFNWDIVSGKQAALTTQIAAVPMVEAGQFRGDYQPNVAGEAYLGGTFMRKISLGLRVAHRFMPYESDYRDMNTLVAYTPTKYRITNYAIDVRFRINGGGKPGAMHRSRN